MSKSPASFLLLVTWENSLLILKYVFLSSCWLYFSEGGHAYDDPLRDVSSPKEM